MGCHSVHVCDVGDAQNFIKMGIDFFQRNSADAAQIFHDTAGWKALETWMK